MTSGAMASDGFPTLHVLLTGVSSFSGSAFAAELASRGHQVTGVLSQPRDSYQGVRADRLAMLGDSVSFIESAPMGSEALTEAIAGLDAIDVVGLHHATVGDFRSPTYDLGSAVASATAGAADIAAATVAKGATAVVFTRSVFESGFGVTDDVRPIGVYAIAKSATAELWRERFRPLDVTMKDFVIANPVGALEEPRFISYLAKTWQSGETPMLRSPHYVRDNVPIQLLAQAYADAIEDASLGDIATMAPSHWVGTNLEFAQRLSREFGSRWQIECAVGIADELDNAEPRVRIATDRVEFESAANEVDFWNEYAAHYAPSGSSS